MSLISFLVFVIVVIAITWIATRAIASFFPGTPAQLPNLLWLLALVIILVGLAQALGIGCTDIRMPTLR